MDKGYLDRTGSGGKLSFDTHAGGPYLGAFFAEASTYAEGPTWLMRGSVVGDKAVA